MKGVSKMYLIQCEKYNCRANAEVTRIFCDIDLGSLPPVPSCSEHKSNDRVTSTDGLVANLTTNESSYTNIMGSYKTPTSMANTADDPTELDFSRNYIGDRGIQAICGVLETIRRLKKISFRGCMIEENGIIALCECFKTHPHIREICLLDNRLFASSGRHLLLLLRANPRIYNLEVNTSEMPQRVAQALEKCIKRNYLIAFPPPPEDTLKGQGDVRCSAYLDKILQELNWSTKLAVDNAQGIIRPSYRMEVGEPDKVIDPEVVMVAIQERVVHYWHLRLGSYAVQYLAEFGISEATIGHLSRVERQFCKLPVNDEISVTSNVRPSAFSIWPLDPPLEIIKKEINTLNALYCCSEPNEQTEEIDNVSLQEGDPATSQPVCTILRSIINCRGRTLEAQLDTCNRLLMEIEKEEINTKKRQQHFVNLIQALYLLRNGIAGISLHDVVNTDIDDDIKVPRVIRDSCSAFEAHLSRDIYHTSETVYEKERKLSLACDMARYFITNNNHLFTSKKKLVSPERMEGLTTIVPMLSLLLTTVAGGTSVVKEFPADTINKYINSANSSFEAAMSMYHSISGVGDSCDSSLMKERMRLLVEGYRHCPTFLREFLDYLTLCRCYVGSFEVQSTADVSDYDENDSGMAQCSGSNLREKEAIAIAMTQPFYVWRPPPMSASQKVEERIRRMERETARHGAARPNVSCIKDALAELKGQYIADALQKKEDAALDVLQYEMVNGRDCEDCDLYEALFMDKKNYNCIKSSLSSEISNRSCDLQDDKVSHTSTRDSVKTAPQLSLHEGEHAYNEPLHASSSLLLTRKDLLGHSDAKDIIQVLGQIKDKHDLKTLCNQYSCWKRYNWVLSNGVL